MWKTIILPRHSQEIIIGYVCSFFFSPYVENRAQPSTADHIREIAGNSPLIVLLNNSDSTWFEKITQSAKKSLVNLPVSIVDPKLIAERAIKSCHLREMRRVTDYQVPSL